jgi:ADP-ribose pyrophosphatase
MEDERGKIIVIKDNNVSVVILAKEGDSFILIRQYRQAVDDYVIQLPGGGVEKGEELEDAVRREFFEETGYQCGSVQYMGYMYPANWISNEIAHVFFSDEIIDRSHQKLEMNEKIQVQKITIAECMDKFRGSEINDSELSFALLQAILKGFIKIFN